MKQISSLIIAVFLLTSSALAFEQGTGSVYTVTLADVEQAIAQAIQEGGTATLATARIDGVTRDTAYGHNAPITATIKALKADPISKRWTANVNFVSGAEIVSVIPMQGRYTEMVMLPTAKRQLSAGQPIAETDIEMRPYPFNFARTSVMKDTASIIGKVPHHAISANRPLREEEFTTPNVVRKNASVTLQYQTASINITTAGQAMEAGSVGDVIQVLNVNSKKIVRATILDKDTVSVSGSTISTAAAAPAPVVAPTAAPIAAQQTSRLEDVYAN